MPVDTLDPNLLASAKKPRETAPTPAAPVSRMRKTLKVVAYAAIFLAAFLFFVVIKLPDSLVTNFVLNQVNQHSPYRAHAERAGLRFFLTPHLEFTNLQLEPKIPNQGIPLKFTELSLYPSFLSLLPLAGPPQPGGSFSAEAYSAQWSGYFSPGSGFRLDAENVDLAKLEPLLEQGVDIKGLITSLLARFDLVDQKFSRANGELRASGKEFLLDPASFQLGMPLPILDLGGLELEARAERGRLQFQKFVLGSPQKDLEIRVEGDVQLADNLQFSRLNLRLRIRPSAKILQAVPALPGMLGLVAAKRADGTYGMKVSGVLASLGMPQPDP
jgi:type II secretion system protein N